MIATEATLLTTLLMMLAIAGYTDCKRGIIANRLLIVCSSVAIPADILYYSLWGRPYLSFFLLNLSLLTVASAVFYCYHLWAAGDSKLLFIVGLLIPGRIYTFGNVGPASGFTIVVFTFSIAFVFVIIESVWLMFKDRVQLKPTLPSMDWRRIPCSYAAMVAATTLLNLLLWSCLGNIFGDSQLLVTAIDFFVVLTLVQLRDKLSTKWLAVISAILWILLLTMWFAGVVELGGAIDLRSWLVVLAIILCRWVAERFNYRTIPTNEVRAGQILSAATIISFTTSHVKGLPTGTTEDLRSRITETEADSVRRWATSVHGKKSVVIVRKIPFAVFIGIGTLCLFVFEVAIQ